MLRFSAILFALTIAPAEATQAPSSLPDKLERTESANFALTGERAELELSDRKRGLGLDFEGTSPNIHFYEWIVVPSWGQGVVYFAVDRRTGDVWAESGCHLVRSQELSAMQAHFRQRANVSDSQVRQIEQEGFPGTC